MTDPNNNVYTYAYDLLNRKTSLTYPGTATETCTYDNTGGGTPAGNGFAFKSGLADSTITIGQMIRLTRNWHR